MQEFHVFVGEGIERYELPSAKAEWAPGRKWGDVSALLTPAWITKQAVMRWRQGAYEGQFGSAVTSLIDEVTFCLLSGFGIRAEIARAAFTRLRDEGCLGSTPEPMVIQTLLEQPLGIEGRQVRYRFPRIRAQYISGAIRYLNSVEIARNDVDLRRQLMAIRGIGPKTASFIVRNYLASDKVAIIDIHLLRAGRISGIFPGSLDLPRDYALLETWFLSFAAACRVPAGVLDIAIWETMRIISPKRLAAAAAANASLYTSDDGERARHDCRRTSSPSATGAGFSNGWQFE